MKMTCTCKHMAQDELHGVGIRVFNQMKDPNKARCTVCSAIKTVPTATKTPTKK